MPAPEAAEVDPATACVRKQDLAVRALQAVERLQHAGAVGCHADEGAAVREEERCAAAAVERRSDEPAARAVPEAQLSVRAATRDRR